MGWILFLVFGRTTSQINISLNAAPPFFSILRALLQGGACAPHCDSLYSDIHCHDGDAPSLGGCLDW